MDYITVKIDAIFFVSIEGWNIRNTSVQYRTIFNHDLNAKIKTKNSSIIKSVWHHFF